MLSYAVSLISVVSGGLNISQKAFVELLGTVIAGRFIINHRMVNGDMGGARFKMAAIFDPEFTSASVQDNSLAAICRILIPAILRSLKKAKRHCKYAE